MVQHHKMAQLVVQHSINHILRGAGERIRDTDATRTRGGRTPAGTLVRHPPDRLRHLTGKLRQILLHQVLGPRKKILIRSEMTAFTLRAPAGTLHPRQQIRQIAPNLLIRADIRHQQPNTAVIGRLSRHRAPPPSRTHHLNTRVFLRSRNNLRNRMTGRHGSSHTTQPQRAVTKANTAPDEDDV